MANINNLQVAPKFSAKKPNLEGPKEAWDTSGYNLAEPASLTYSAETNIGIADQNNSMAAATWGVQGDNLLEPVPNFIRRKSDNIVKGSNNTWIVLGRDRPGELGSGHGAETGAGTIDIVVGRMSSDIRTVQRSANGLSLNENLSIDNNITLDASRIYISQKTDVDENFNLAAGTVGMTTAKAAIAVKSDAIRLIAREGIKIVTGVDERNSMGREIVSIPSIDLIAGNSDTELQPVVKGDDLKEFLTDTLIGRIDELNSILDTFITAQMEFNAQIASHEHPDFFAIMCGFTPNQGNCPPSLSLMQAGVKAAGDLGNAKKDAMMNKLKITMGDVGGLTPFGSNGFTSKHVNVT